MKHKIKIPGSLLVASLLSLFVLPHIGTAQIPVDSRVIVHLNKPLVESPVDVVTVGDVAKVIGGPASLRERIQKLDLDAFENGNSELDISLEQIRYRLLLARIEQHRFEVVGIQRTHVQQISLVDHRRRIEQLLTTELAIQFGLPAETVQISLDAREFESLLDEEIDLSTSHLAIAFGTELPVGERRLEVRFVDAAGNQLTKTMALTTAVMRDLVIAQENISRGEIIDASRVTRVRRPITDRATRFASYEQVVGKSAQQDIQQFDVVRSQYVSAIEAEEAPLVKRNQLVTAVLRRGNLTIHLNNVRTSDDGRFGDTIEVVNPITRKRILAQVISSDTVEIR